MRLEMRATPMMSVKHGDNPLNVCLGGGRDVDEFTPDQRIALIRKVPNTAYFQVTSNVIASR